jgi:hypothetical protein
VWEDFAITLVEEAGVGVAGGDFPEREEYLRHQHPR